MPAGQVGSGRVLSGSAHPALSAQTRAALAGPAWVSALRSGLKGEVPDLPVWLLAGNEAGIQIPDSVGNRERGSRMNSTALARWIRVRGRAVAAFGKLDLMERPARNVSLLSGQGQVVR